MLGRPAGVKIHSPHLPKVREAPHAAPEASSELAEAVRVADAAVATLGLWVSLGSGGDGFCKRDGDAVVHADGTPGEGQR